LSIYWICEKKTGEAIIIIKFVVVDSTEDFNVSLFGISLLPRTKIDSNINKLWTLKEPGSELVYLPYFFLL